MKLLPKQTAAIEILENQKTVELYYGGAAGGGKSDLGCYWQLKKRINYPGTRGLIGRAHLKTLKETTLKTFFDRAKKEGLKRGIHFDLTSAQDKENPNCILFENNSLIYLKDLYAYPSDPDFDDLGSLEITDAFIDEAPQISDKCKNIVRSRIRFRLQEYNLMPKMLMTGNPSKNWAYSDFYKANKEGSIRDDRAFVQALPKDNPHLPQSYLDSLLGLDKNSCERLYYGNWEYDDDPSALISYDSIIDCFTNYHVPHGEKYITADIARFGDDKTVIAVWDGGRVMFFQYKKKSITETADIIRELQTRYKVTNSNTLADEDGVGGGVVDILRCKGFINNSKALKNPVTHKEENYQNLKTQCYYMLAERINKGLIYIENPTAEVREATIEELEQVKQYNMDKDGKMQIVPKEVVKQKLGRSPDFSDTLMMREFFNLIPKREWVAI